MTYQPYIHVRNVHVSFPIHLDNTRSFRVAALNLLRLSGPQRIYHGALSNVSFTAKPGDRIALLGSNGSGKTTLLRALNGVYQPSQGQIFRRGETAALINNTMGMDYFASGIENIFLRGLFLGYSREQMARKVDDIVSFAELNDDIFRPVRHYSSGMLARLAFGIATSVRAQIYLMDEWIGAGDKRFFERAEKRIEDMFDERTILILASHSDALCHKWCDFGLVLEKGSQYYFGEVKEATKIKNRLMNGERPRVPIKQW